MSEVPRPPASGRTVSGVPARRRSALDRLTPPPQSTAPPEVEPADDDARRVARPADDPGSGWGIAAMPAWLESEPAERDPDDFGVDDLDDEDAAADDRHGPAPRRFAIAPPAAVVVILVGVIACAVAGFEMFRDSGTVPAVDFPQAGITSGSTVVESGPRPASSGEPTPATLVISVVGLVRRPGLVHVPADARVADAIAAAGGARDRADTVSLNLAQPLRDGDQILVGYAGGRGRMSLRSAVVPAGGGTTTPSAGVPSAGSATPGAPEGLVNLNTADAAELDRLPGVGPVTAQAIIDWRTRNGGFRSVDQLGEVDGIGPARLAKLRDLVTV
ncbi:MAG: ComEA family DNA-binding protein [Gordonia sp. (in: high G+C Gram-positive bacteria)]